MERPASDVPEITILGGTPGTIHWFTECGDGVCAGISPSLGEATIQALSHVDAHCRSLDTF
jgi:hypothetical protein